MKHSNSYKQRFSTFRFGTVMIGCTLTLMCMALPASALSHLEFVLLQGFNTADTTLPVPHVMCKNASAAPGTPAYARANMYLGALNANPRYTVWRCYSSSYIYSSQLSVQPTAGDVIEQTIHGISDALNPSVDIETCSYQVLGVSCRNLTQGGATVTSTTPTATVGTVEQWDCNFASPPNLGDNIVMIIQGTYL